MADRYRPDRIAGRVRVRPEPYAEAMLDYPFQVSELLDEFKDGDVEIRIKPEGFDEAVEKLEASRQPARPLRSSPRRSSSAPR